MPRTKRIDDYDEDVSVFESDGSGMEIDDNSTVNIGSRRGRRRGAANNASKKEEIQEDSESEVYEEEDASCLSPPISTFAKCADDIDRICGRRPNSESSDGFEYALRHKGVSYLHLEWVTRQKLDTFDFKKNIIVNRFFKKIRESDEDPNGEILVFPTEYFNVDSIIDCADAIIEVNPSVYLTGWRMLSPEEELPKGIKIYDLPPTWRERLGESEEAEPIRGNMLNELAGGNPFLHLRKDISQYYPKDNSKVTPNSAGSVFRYERIYYVKWMDLSISESTWERSCDLNDDVKIQQFVDYNTIPPRLMNIYGDYLPENYISLYIPHSMQTDRAAIVPVIQQTKGKRGRPRKTDVPRRRSKLRMCIDLAVPVVDKSEAKANGYRPPLSGIWRRILNIVMVLSNCRQLDIATFCGFAQSSLSLWVNGKYCGDTKQMLNKLKSWVDKTYPDLGKIARSNAQLDPFLKACRPWLLKYVRGHPELELTDQDVDVLLGLQKDPKAELKQKKPKSLKPKEILSEKKEISNEFSPFPPKEHSDKIYESEFDYDESYDYCANFGPIGSCTLLTEMPASADQQDRTVVFNVLDGVKYKPPHVSMSNIAEKKPVALPPAIAAPLPEKIALTYTQGVRLDEIKAVHDAGIDVSYSMNDVMKTVIYRDHEIDPAGYAIRNTVVGVIDNTVDTYNSIRTFATDLRSGNKFVLDVNNLASTAETTLPPINSKNSFAFNPVIQSNKANDVAVKNEEENSEDEDQEVVDTKIEEKKGETQPKKPGRKPKNAVSTPIKPEETQETRNETPSSVVPSTKMIALNRAKNRAFEESRRRKTVTVDDMMCMLFKPSQLNAPVAPLPPPPPLPMKSEFTKYEKSPVYKDGLQLREYQVVSLNWMIEKWRANEGMILGDEMGLGKTIQVISLLHHFITVENQEGPFLVVSPLSTLKNWMREFLTWTSIRVCLYHSEGKGKEERQLIQTFNWFFKGLPARNLYKFNVLLTTYEVVMKDWSLLGEIHYTGVVMDEAHRMRNNNCKFMQFVNNIKTDHKLLLTGTPLQNNTGELWPLLNFIEVKEAGSMARFKEEFGDLHSSEQVEKLRALLSSCMMRRVKEDVEKSIPRKQETIVEVELTITQKQYYKAIYDRNRSFLYKGCKKSDVPSLMHVETQLRKVCNHPFLIKGVREKEEQLTEEAMKAKESNQGDTVDEIESRHRLDVPSIVSCSGKMVLLDKLLPKLQQEGHRVLIFSQFVKMLDILEEYCQLRMYKVARIDGQTKGNDRQMAIDAFSRQDSDYFIFLLSTRAGGLGINLTAADTVIIYDSDWNPQNDSQATARCHRIGQKQEVTVYRLLTRNTYEYEMFERASRKLAIESVVLDREKLAVTTPIDESVVPEEPPTSVVDSEKPRADESMEVESQITEEKTQLNDLPNDDDYIQEDSEYSHETKITVEDEPSVTTEKTETIVTEYDIPETPVVIQKKKRGRKPTKPRTLEDELNPFRRSKNEVEEMLRRGLFDCIIAENKGTSLNFFDADIDTILKNNTRSGLTANGMPPKEEVMGVERGGTIYSKRKFNPEENAKQVDLNDPDFWEKMLDHPNADMLWQRLQDTNLMQDASSVDSWVRDLDNLVHELCEELEGDSSNEYNVHEADTVNRILTTASTMHTVFGKKTCQLMLQWMEQLEQMRFRRRNTTKKQDDLLQLPPKAAESVQGMCSKCYKEEGPEPGQKLIACSGRCCLQYHLACVGLKHIPTKWKCKQCISKVRECFICHRKGKEGDALGKGRKRVFTFYEQWLRYNDIELFINLFGSGGFIDSNRESYMVPEPLIKCTQHNCGCFYHMSCVRSSPRFVMYPEQHPCAFRCPRHYCRVCGNSAVNQVLLVCVKCCNAYHSNCLKSVPHTNLVKKFIICNEHSEEKKSRKRKEAPSEETKNKQPRVANLSKHVKSPKNRNRDVEL